MARRLAGSLLVLVIFGAGYWVGQIWRIVPSGNGGYQVQYLTGQDTGKPQAVDFSRFWTAWSIADQGYYGRGDDSSKRVDGAIAGMLSSLGDPYTTYLPKDENEMFQTDLSGEFSGIGAEISSINGYPTIVAPLTGSPAERAGLKAKDVILKVDGQDTESENFAAVINRIRGANGTTVTLTISREGESKPLEIKITREKITLPNVKGEVKQSGDWSYCYVSLNEFVEDSDNKVASALNDCADKGVKRAVLDLRNNPGGLLDTAVSLASKLIDPTVKPGLNKVIVWQKDRDNKLTSYPTTATADFKDWPLVVLVNEGSASASEILAGALKDYGRASLVGQKTFGKGSVQELRNLSDGSSIKLTVAKWLTPNQTEIDHQGIEPDVKVEASTDSTGATDPQLDAAVAALKSR